MSHTKNPFEECMQVENVVVSEQLEKPIIEVSRAEVITKDSQRENDDHPLDEVLTRCEEELKLLECLLKYPECEDGIAVSNGRCSKVLDNEAMSQTLENY